VFRLVFLREDNLTLEEIERRLGGKTPGQWIEPFMSSYRADGSYIGVNDPSWYSPERESHFPYLHPNEVLDFEWAGIAPPSIPGNIFQWMSKTYGGEKRWLWIVPEGRGR